jgi:hypothetical protein
MPMTLPARQQRVLGQIEVTLQARDPRLMSLFATFARLTWHEAMPTTEQLGARLSGMLRPVLLDPGAAGSNGGHRPARFLYHRHPALPGHAGQPGAVHELADRQLPPGRQQARSRH